MKKARLYVQKIGDTSVLYYREKEIRDRKLPPLRAVTDLYYTLMGIHRHLSHGRRNRTEKYLVEYGSHVPRPVIQLFLDLCQICQATIGRKRTQKTVHKPIIPHVVGQRVQANPVDLQLFEDNGYRFIQVLGLPQKVDHSAATQDKYSG